jgi:hypothetical protein
MDHLSHIGIIPAPEWDAWDEIFVIDQSESLRRKKTAVVVAKVVQSNTRLTESVDSTDWADEFEHFAELLLRRVKYLVSS